MKLEAHQLDAIVRCRNEECIGYIVGAGLVTATSAMVSGSIVLAGNAIYWLETQGNCTPNPVSSR